MKMRSRPTTIESLIVGLAGQHQADRDRGEDERQLHGDHVELLRGPHDHLHEEVGGQYRRGGDDPVLDVTLYEEGQVDEPDNGSLAAALGPAQLGGDPAIGPVVHACVRGQHEQVCGGEEGGSASCRAGRCSGRKREPARPPAGP
jgi:hypothetical protein